MKLFFAKLWLWFLFAAILGGAGYTVGDALGWKGLAQVLGCIAGLGVFLFVTMWAVEVIDSDSWPGI